MWLTGTEDVCNKCPSVMEVIFYALKNVQKTEDTISGIVREVNFGDSPQFYFLKWLWFTKSCS